MIFSVKVLAVIYLHRNWQEVGRFARCFFITVIGALTIITSMEVLGFLIQRHASATRAGDEILRGHIDVVDQTLAGLPADYVTKRLREREAA